MHEVVFTDATARALAAAAAAGRSQWRVSSTLFAHAASDALLRPLGRFGVSAGVSSDMSADTQQQQLSAYPPTLAGEYVRKELEAINLGKTGASSKQQQGGGGAGAAAAVMPSAG